MRILIAAALMALPGVAVAQTAGEPGGSAHSMATGDQPGQPNGTGSMTGSTPGTPAAGAAAETSNSPASMPAAKPPHHKHKQTDATATPDGSATPK